MSGVRVRLLASFAALVAGAVAVVVVLDLLHTTLGKEKPVKYPSGIIQRSTGCSPSWPR